MSNFENHLSKPKNLIDSLFQLLVRLFQYITYHRRCQLVLLMILTLFSTISEVISIGVVIPFVGILTQPEVVFNHPSIEGVLQLLDITSAESLVLPLVIAFAIAVVASGGLRLLLVWVNLRLSSAIGIELGAKIYSKTLYQPYHVHLSRGSSEIISGLTSKVDSVSEIIMSLMVVSTSALLLLGILATLFTIDPIMTAALILVFGSCYIITAGITRVKLLKNSQCIAEEETQVLKTLQEGLGGIRDIILDGSQAIHTNIYRKTNLKLKRAIFENRFISQSPRYIMEVLGMLTIASLAYLMIHRSEGMEAQLPLLGALALGAQRSIPLLQQLYANWAHLAWSKFSLNDALNLLDQPLPKNIHQTKKPPLRIKTSIKLDNVYFRYRDKDPWVLEGVNLTIPKGSRFGFVGITGSGKSTVLDLIMALLKPTQGRILVNDQSIGSHNQQAWQNNIAHVPQSIFLADATIAENIAFGLPLEHCNEDRIKKAAHQAQIDEFIESLPDGYGTFVGEQGIRISGGQRQRIAIARALYKKAEVLVFDEATSALDNKTEKDLMASIENLRDITILIIAHRITTLQNCDTIIHLKKGNVFMQGSFEQFKNSNTGPTKLPNEDFKL